MLLASKYFSEFLKLSKQITIIVGAVEEAANYGIYNSAFVFEDNNVHSAHKKNYPPTYGMFEEMRYFSQGKDVVDIAIISVDGKVVYRSSVQLQPGTSVVNIDIANLPAGMYMIKGMFSDGQTNTIKFTKK